MMFFIPPAILAIEDEDDRSFMENLYRSYYRLITCRAGQISYSFFSDSYSFRMPLFYGVNKTTDLSSSRQSCYTKN